MKEREYTPEQVTAQQEEAQVWEEEWRERNRAERRSDGVKRKGRRVSAARAKVSKGGTR